MRLRLWTYSNLTASRLNEGHSSCRSLGGSWQRAHQGCYSKTLYHIGGFFAEVWRPPANNRIISVRGFESKGCLDPYLNMMDLDDLKE